MRILLEDEYESSQVKCLLLKKGRNNGTVNGETVQQRADRINRDYFRHAEAIDAKFPGSTVLDELNRYGIDGKRFSLS